MVVMFLVAGILAGVIGMIAATALGLGLGLILAAYPVCGMVGVGLSLALALIRQDLPNAESSPG